MSATVMFYKFKAKNILTDDGYEELLEMVRSLLPPDNILPSSLSSTKKLLKAFDLGYEKIHACVNDCCLFRKKLEKVETCPTCGASRWKVNKHTQKIDEGVPVKVLRYFPIIPRFRRMFKDPEKAEHLTWHYTHKSQDGKMRHPVDSLAWKKVDSKWPSFAKDPRNLRLGLSADGFNPFGDRNSQYSCWPVTLVAYNLPPSLCKVKEHLLLTEKEGNNHGSTSVQHSSNKVAQLKENANPSVTQSKQSNPSVQRSEIRSPKSKQSNQRKTSRLQHY